MHEAIKKITNWQKTSSELRNATTKLAQVAKQPSCDKHGLRFTQDTKFAQSLIPRLNLESYEGFYGSSSCSQFIHLRMDEKELAPFVTKALNGHIDMVLKWIADEIDADVKKNKGELQNYINELTKTLNEIEGTDYET